VERKKEKRERERKEREGVEREDKNLIKRLGERAIAKVNNKLNLCLIFKILKFKFLMIFETVWVSLKIIF
jgi:hypothetical protein